VLHWNKLGAPPLLGYLPIIGQWLPASWDVSSLDLWAEVRANGRVAHYMCKIHQR
jgi:hypothetical protein